MNTPETCSNCNKSLKNSVFVVTIPPENDLKLINEYSDEKYEALCNKCAKNLKENVIGDYKKEVTYLRGILEKNIEKIPIVTTHTPVNWNYEVLGMVTGQSVTGTGVFSEFSSSFTDFFGSQSKSFNRKIRNGELLCQAQLRLQTLELGGNAIIATDIDYSEAGSVKGMLMVCMAGTAIKLKNLDVLSQGMEQVLSELVKANKRLQYLSTLN